jgi:hypothetical protein
MSSDSENKLGQECIPCTIKSKSTDVTTKGLSFEIVKGLIIATTYDTKNQNPLLSLDGSTYPAHQYFICIYDESVCSYVNIMDFYTNNSGTSLYSLTLHINSNKQEEWGNEDMESSFAKYLRENPRLFYSISALNMDNRQLYQYIMSFVPKLVYLSNVNVKSYFVQDNLNPSCNVLNYELHVKNQTDDKSDLYTLMFDMSFTKGVLIKDWTYHTKPVDHDACQHVSTFIHKINDDYVLKMQTYLKTDSRTKDLIIYLSGMTDISLVNFCIMNPIWLFNYQKTPISLTY